MNHDPTGVADRRGAADGAADIARIAHGLAHPLRVVLARYTANHGPCSFTQLAALTGASPGQVGNHLAVLRDCGVLTMEREGRTSWYRVPDSRVAEAVENLAAAAGAPSEVALDRPATSLARRCTDHVGGALGVGVLDAVVAAGELRPDPGRPRGFTLSDAEHPVLTALVGRPALRETVGRAAAAGSRALAVGCEDTTEHALHLGGGLGAAVLDAARRRGWVEDVPGSRALSVTADGARELRRIGVGAAR